MVDLRLFFPDFLIPTYLIAAFLKGIQPSDLRLDFGLLVRQFSLAFLNCLRDLVWVSVMACKVWLCRFSSSPLPFT
jgi:hypothetical protein|tara:strand:+ start:1960 stop:2187 length:228 start_codon:yes stop_codon:yes gene_type:complete